MTTAKQESYIRSLAKRRGLTEYQLRGLAEYIWVIGFERMRVGDGWKPTQPSHPLHLKPIEFLMKEDASELISILKSDFLFESYLGMAQERGFIPPRDWGGAS